MIQKNIKKHCDLLSGCLQRCKTQNRPPNSNLKRIDISIAFSGVFLVFRQKVMQKNTDYLLSVFLVLIYSKSNFHLFLLN